MSELNGRVAIITGAGRGLGREEALYLARCGVSVVVNDVDRDDANAAAKATVEEIRDAGGRAVHVAGDCADTQDSQRVFQTALETYGDINIVINNAGFCRDNTIFSMSDEEFDSVVRVHLRGHFVNMRAATAYWRNKAKSGDPVYGRLISTSSEAMIFGSAGQPNYAAAKAGITAMTMGAAQLMAKYGVTCNVIMPRARTDMTNSGMTAELFKAPEEGFDVFNPANVAPLVGYLASERAAQISGEVFVVWGGRVSIVQRPTLDVYYDNPRGGRWDEDALHDSLSDYFTPEHTMVLDGFSVPPQ
jgi:3-oxoacyl-[acyl-carrier protein] reductase